MRSKEIEKLHIKFDATYGGKSETDAYGSTIHVGDVYKVDFGEKKYVGKATVLRIDEDDTVHFVGVPDCVRLKMEKKGE